MIQLNHSYFGGTNEISSIWGRVVGAGKTIRSTGTGRGLSISSCNFGKSPFIPDNRLLVVITFYYL